MEDLTQGKSLAGRGQHKQALTLFERAWRDASQDVHRQMILEQAGSSCRAVAGGACGGCGGNLGCLVAVGRKAIQEREKKKEQEQEKRKEQEKAALEEAAARCRAVAGQEACDRCGAELACLVKTHDQAIQEAADRCRAVAGQEACERCGADLVCLATTREKTLQDAVDRCREVAGEACVRCGADTACLVTTRDKAIQEAADRCRAVAGVVCNQCGGEFTCLVMTRALQEATNRCRAVAGEACDRCGAEISCLELTAQVPPQPALTGKHEVPRKEPGPKEEKQQLPRGSNWGLALEAEGGLLFSTQSCENSSRCGPWGSYRTHLLARPSAFLNLTTHLAAELGLATDVEDAVELRPGLRWYQRTSPERIGLTAELGVRMLVAPVVSSGLGGSLGLEIPLGKGFAVRSSMEGILWQGMGSAGLSAGLTYR